MDNDLIGLNVDLADFEVRGTLYNSPFTAEVITRSSMYFPVLSWIKVEVQPASGTTCRSIVKKNDCPA